MKKKAKILESRCHGVTESRSPGITESRSFLVRYRRTYVLKKLWGSKNPKKGLLKKSQPIKKETYFFGFI